MDKYVILGVGKYIVNIEEILDAGYSKKLERSYEILGFIDSDSRKHGKDYYGFKVLGSVDILNDLGKDLNIVSFINPVGRHEVLSFLSGISGLLFPNIIHPSAVISPRAKIGHGNIFAQNVIVAPYVTIGDFNHLNYAVSIGHHCRIGNFTTCNGGAHIAGSSVLEDMVFVGPGAVIIDGVTVGSLARVGANAVVRKDVPSGDTVVGVPAKSLNVKTVKK